MGGHGCSGNIGGDSRCPQPLGFSITPCEGMGRTERATERWKQLYLGTEGQRAQEKSELGHLHPQRGTGDGAVLPGHLSAHPGLAQVSSRTIMR